MGGAVLTAVLQPLISQLISPKTRLSVNIHLSKFEPLSGAKELIRTYSQKLENLTERYQFSEEVEKIIEIKGFANIELKNNSKITINNISISINKDYGEIYVRNDKDEKEIFARRTSTEIKSLRPNEECSVQVWSSSGFADYTRSILEAQFRIFADQLNDVEIKFRGLEYIEREYKLIKRSIVNTASIFLPSAILILLFVVVSIAALLTKRTSGW